MSTNNSRIRDTTSKKKECYTFEPQQWRKSVCKNCFRSLHDHPTEPPLAIGGGGNGKGLSPRTSPLLGSKSVSATAPSSVSSTSASKDPVVLRKGETSPTSRRRPKSDEFKQKTPSPRQSQRSLTSSGRRSPGSSPSSSTNRHSGSFTAQNRQNSTSSIDVKYVEELENDFFDLEDRYDGLSKEKCDLEGEICEKNRSIEELQDDVESYKIKILQLERRVQHLDEEIRSYRERLKLPESEQGHIDPNSGLGSQHHELLAENEQLRVRLEEIEQLCQEVMEENELLKEEQEEMQREIEEMHDHFQEDDTDTLRELKRDLETSNKNCRIFQFKLRKTERRYEQCENERALLEDKLNRLESQLYSENDVNLIRGLEEELRVAKEVSVRLNSELELVDEKRSYFEEDNKHVKEDLQDSEKRRKTLEGELSKCRQEIEKLKSIDTGALMIPETHTSRKTKILESMSREASFEEQSLQRELDAARERETDLNEQLKFSEDEIRKLKRRLNDAEEENDSLTKKLEALMNNKNIDDNEYEDLSVHALKIQMELLDQENSSLRKKFVLIEKENTGLINELRQMKSQTRQAPNNNLQNLGETSQELESKIADLKADVSRLEDDNKLLSLQNVGNQNSLGNSKTGPPQYRIDEESILKSQNQELRLECRNMKEQIRQYDKQIKRAMDELETRYGTQAEDQKQLDMLLKYGEVTTRFREQQTEILQIRKQMDARNEEYEKYKEFFDRHSKSEVKKRNETKSGLENASKAVLLEEIGCLEEEIDELASKYERAETKLTNLSKTMSEKDMVIEEMICDNEKNELELKKYVQDMLMKNSLLNELLNCVQSRADDLQAQFDRMMSQGESSEGSTTTMTSTDLDSTGGSQSGLASIGSDNAFVEASVIHQRTPINLNDVEKIKFQFSCLERQLTEERKRTRIAEKQAEMAQKDGAHSGLTDDSKIRRKEVEILKRDLEERNEMLEEKEQNLQDMRARLEQTRKMNEALRTLLDKQDETTPGSPSQKNRDSKESNIEINSYKKEISIMKADVRQYAIKMSESEKIREKLAKEIRNLQAEMKVREEQIYEQDDEMRAKDQEIRTIRKLLEDSQGQSRSHDQSEEMNEKEEQVKSLMGEIEHLRLSLHNYKSHCEEIEFELRQNKSDQKLLTDSVRTRDERIKEKDDLIFHLNQRLQNREKELTDFDLIIKETNAKLDKNDGVIKSMQMDLSKKDFELASLKVKNEELLTGHDNVTGHLNKVLKDNEEFKLRIAEQEKEKSKTQIVPRISTTAPSSDVDRLKGEVAQLKKDKEGLIEKLNKTQGTFSALRKDSDNAKSDSEAYTKAIQQQQYLTRVSLLTDNVTRLNRANIELKLHNESIQNDMLEYQRRYKNIKEQYEAEEETWAAERIIIESRMKEYEDRKSMIVSVRKALQDASLKVANLEALLTREKQDNERRIEEIERERSELQKRLSRYEEKEKLPKVFLKFGGKMTSRTTNEMLQDKEKTELKVKLEAADKMIQKLRLEIAEKDEHFHKQKAELINKSEETRIHLEGLIEILSTKLAEMEGIREQLFLLKERIFTLEESEERDRKIWNEERMIFQFKLEDSRFMIESWLEKIREMERGLEDQRPGLADNLGKDIEKYLHSKESIPYAQMYRRIQSQQDHAVTSQSSNQTGTIFGKPPMKSVSLDWTNRMSRSQVAADWSNSNQSINITPYSRSNRSVSPDQSKSSVTTRKITNYPDPTPGFLLKPSSRQSSVESVSKESDYTQRSFTLPGMRNSHNASRISPARQKFFETTPTSETPVLNLPMSSVDDKNKVSDSVRSSHHVPDLESVVQKVPEPAKSDTKVKFSQSTTSLPIVTKIDTNQDSLQARSVKPKSTSIAPSIQQLRLKFAQKSNSTAGCDSSTSKK